MHRRSTRKPSPIVSQIREMLEQAGLTQKEVAQRLGITPSQLNRYFQSKTDMSGTRLVLLLQCLGIDLEGILADNLRSSQMGVKLPDTAALLVRLENMKPYNRKPLLRLIKALAG